MATHFCVLPEGAMQSLSLCNQPTSYLRLPHPRTGLSSLFLPVETQEGDAGAAISQILELQAINPANQRSWLLENEVIADGKLLLMTPMDPVFLLLPILQSVHPIDGSAGQYKPADDIFEEAAWKIQQSSLLRKDTPISSSDILHFTGLRCSRNALRLVCDIKEITEEITVYRYSHAKALEYLRKKVARLSNSKTLEKSKTITRGFAKDGLMEDGNEALLKHGQIRASCELLSQYLSPDIRDSLYASYDFTQLDEFLKESAAEAMALASVTQKVERVKRVAAQGTGEKKRKPAKGSHGVEALKKVNVNGMAKLSTFFKKTGKEPS